MLQLVLAVWPALKVLSGTQFNYLYETTNIMSRVNLKWAANLLHLNTLFIQNIWLQKIHDYPKYLKKLPHDSNTSYADLVLITS